MFSSSVVLIHNVTCYLDGMSDLAQAISQLRSYDQPLNYDSDYCTLQGSDSILTVLASEMSVACCSILLRIFGVCFCILNDTFYKHQAILDTVLQIRVEDICSLLD